MDVMAGTAEGYGSVSWWGLSPPLDLLSVNQPQDPIGG